LPEEVGQFDSEWRRAMSRAAENLDLSEVFETLIGGGTSPISPEPILRPTGGCCSASIGSLLVRSWVR
jgi:hypothetical protein